MDNRYYNLNFLGRGAFGTVKKAIKNGRIIAVKKIEITNEIMAKKVEQEITFLKELSDPVCHNSLVCYYGSQRVGNTIFVEMEYVPGDTLEKFATYFRYDPKFYQHLTAIIIDISKGLQYIQSKGIIHRDISPNNIIISPTNIKELPNRTKIANSVQPKLIDFGLSCFAKNDICNYGRKDVYCCKGNAGTIFFSAPEVILHGNSYFSSDIFSLGASIYYAATKQYIYDSYGKFDPDNALERLQYYHLYAKIPVLQTNSNLDNLVNRMLIKDPTKRITANEILSFRFF